MGFGNFPKCSFDYRLAASAEGPANFSRFSGLRNLIIDLR
jgi:hypothetical protein